MTSTPLVVPSVFHGPPGSGNGGWSAGALALMAGPGLGGTVEVTLRQPPPLDTPLPVTAADGVWTAADPDGAPVLSARLIDQPLVAPEPVPVETAQAAEAAYDGWREHPFPGCFVCGTEREDGLRIFPGRLPGRPEAVAASWVPAASTYEIAWAALDCAGAWACELAGRMLVLGRMTARVDRLPEVGAAYVVTGEVLPRDAAVDGRRHHARTALHDAHGALLGVAEQVWWEVDASVFGR